MIFGKNNNLSLIWGSLQTEHLFYITKLSNSLTDYSRVFESLLNVIKKSTNISETNAAMKLLIDEFEIHSNINPTRSVLNLDDFVYLFNVVMCCISNPAPLLQKYSVNQVCFELYEIYVYEYNENKLFVIQTAENLMNFITSTIKIDGIKINN